ncbi:MAG: N-methylhydantoinase [Chloroflexota bacterium]|jgi:N-methylhydantoinase B|nr:N-methylhydantoinase [Chloroflexota bacterium]
MSGRSRDRLDPVTFGVLSSALVSVAEEMGAALRASSYSPIIREMQDYSCALLDADGRLVAQGEFIPAQLGAIASVIRSTLEAHRGSLAAGDVFIANHPYRGGAHTPDVNVIRPIFQPGGRSGRLLGWAGTVAHQVDFGGPNPGTEGADHRDLFAEGLILPPIRLETAAGPTADLYELVAANVRDPVATLADLRAQVAACRVGERRLLELLGVYGRSTIEAAFRDVIDHAERRTRAALAALPDGEAAAEACLDDDGAGGPPARIAVRLHKHGDRLTVDLSGSAGQVPGGLNVPWASTLASVAYLVRAVSDPTIPANEGTLAPVTIVCPEGSVFRPRPPAAVSVRHLTIQRLADVMVQAAATLWPERVPVAGHFVGFFSIMAVGPSPRDGRPVVLQDVVGGGTGAHAGGPGLDAVDTHLSNVGLLSAEVCETEYAWRLVRSELLPGSGGRGRWPGGRGVRRTYEVLAARQPVVLYCEQTDSRWRPRGAAGGGDGAVTRLVVRDPAGRRRFAPRKGTITLEPGSTVTIETGGGGGYGAPASAAPSRDVRR